MFSLQAAFGKPDLRESAERILRKRSFVIGHFLLGLAVPLVLMVMAYRSASEAGDRADAAGVKSRAASLAPGSGLKGITRVRKDQSKR